MTDPELLDAVRAHATAVHDVPLLQMLDGLPHQCVPCQLRTQHLTTHPQHPTPGAARSR